MRIIVSFILVTVTFISNAQTVNICVSGSSSIPPGLTCNYLKNNFLDAYNQLDNCIQTSPSSATKYSIVLFGPQEISLTGNASEAITWNGVSGTATKPIDVYSYGQQATITRADNANTVMLTMNNAKYIQFFNIHFKNSTNGFLLDNVDNSKISYCKFSGNRTTQDSAETAGIWIGKNLTPYVPGNFGQDAAQSENNEIFHNLFENFRGPDYCESHKDHIIYLSWGNANNSIYGNTFLFAPPEPGFSYPVGDAITINHGFQTNNSVANNFFELNYYKPPTTPWCESNSLNSPYDNIQHSRHAVYLHYEDGDAKYYPLSTQINSITNNVIVNNYAATNINMTEFVFDGESLAGNALFAERNNGTLLGNNQMSSNEVSYNSAPAVYDPYWRDHNSEALSTIATLNGDFDEDGSKDDVAVIYEYPGQSTQVHVWTHETGNVLRYHGVKWSGALDATKIKGRVVAGSFDSDSHSDDIAAIYDNGNGGIEIIVFLWNKNQAKFINNSWKTISSGFFANAITGRVVCGDFDNDGLDDIATFYDLGNTGTEVDMFFSTGSSFTYSGGNNSWWSVASGFDSNKITDRIVSGDFDNNGKDDIAAVYEAGPYTTEIEVFLSNGIKPFIYQGGSGNWWSSSGFSSQSVKGRVVSGNFDSDSYKDDIAMIYSLGGGSTEIEVFLSGGSRPFAYSGGNNNWWASTGYDATKITNAVVAGDFSSANPKDDILAFYDYADYGWNVRTNVWQSTGSNFQYVNNSIGFPWKFQPATSSGARLNSMINENQAQAVNTESVDTETHSEFEIFPNPSSELFKVMFTTETYQQVNIDIMTMDGRAIGIVNHHYNPGKYLVDLTSSQYNLNTGIYLIILKKGGQQFSKKIAVIH